MKRSCYIFIIGLLCLLVFNSFVKNKNINPPLPAGFPKPVFDLAKTPVTEENFQLGRKLFYDPILSSDSTVSCANCHQQFSAFSNLAHPLSHGVKGAIGKRNAPALQNLIWQSSFMWDGNVAHLLAQPMAPIINKLEMNESAEGVIKKLQHSSIYAAEFKKAFGSKGVSTQTISLALSQFMALMISSESKYDQYLRGDVTFTASEERGLKAFREKCTGCHKEPLFTNNDFRNNGLQPNAITPDSGRAVITAKKEDLFKFKVPSLRNVAVSAPYMHDGRFANLQQVLEHYASGIYASAATDAMLGGGMELSATDKNDIISFLKTLTDRNFLYDKRFSDPFYTQNFLKDTH